VSTAQIQTPARASSAPAGLQRQIRERIAGYDWASVRASLHEQGHARLSGLLTQAQCDELIALYPIRERFRSFIDMSPRRFGEGTYRYFDNPLPPLVRTLRTQMYSRLAPVANAWNGALKKTDTYPPRLTAFLKECHRAGQHRPTPLLLHYDAEGFNCIHQDVYGPVAFPLQLACLLSASPLDEEPAFTGGEFIISEQRPRQQTRVEALSLRRGEGLIFANRYRPVEGTRGWYRATVKHGVSRVRTGERFTLGVIFHDAL